MDKMYFFGLVFLSYKAEPESIRSCWPPSWAGLNRRAYFIVPAVLWMGIFQNWSPVGLDLFQSIIAHFLRLVNKHCPSPWQRWPVNLDREVLPRLCCCWRCIWSSLSAPNGQASFWAEICSYCDYNISSFEQLSSFKISSIRQRTGCGTIYHPLGKQRKRNWKAQQSWLWNDDFISRTKPHKSLKVSIFKYVTIQDRVQMNDDVKWSQMLNRYSYS